MTSTSICFSDFVSLGLIRNLEILADESNCVLWVRDCKLEQQLYLSNTYTRLFGRECLDLYKNPLSWSKSLNMEDNDSFLNELILIRTIISPDYTAVFSINHPNGEVRWFQDRSIQVSVSHEHQKIIIGCALYVPSQELIHSDQGNISEQLDLTMIKFFKKLITSYKPSQTAVANILKNDFLLKNLSKREKEVFVLFIQGNTIAQVAHLVHLSPRTIEDHLANLKEKLGCATKSDLIMKAIENGWMTINLT